jgi:hypothetical protein
VNTPDAPPLADVASLELDAAGVTTVLWATGYHRAYPWLRRLGWRRARSVTSSLPSR